MKTRSVALALALAAVTGTAKAQSYPSACGGHLFGQVFVHNDAFECAKFLIRERTLANSYGQVVNNTPCGIYLSGGLGACIQTLIKEGCANSNGRFRPDQCSLSERSAEQFLATGQLPPPRDPNAVTCAFVAGHRACHPLDQWKQQAELWCDRYRRAKAFADQEQAQGWGENRMYGSPQSALLNRDQRIEADALSICTGDQFGLSDAQHAADQPQ